MTKFEKALEDYLKKFNKPYPLMIVSDLDQYEILEDIYRCIEKDIPAKPPTYEDDVDY